MTASWDDQAKILKDINLNFAPKKLYAVVGTVGSGKVSEQFDERLSAETSKYLFGYSTRARY